MAEIVLQCRKPNPLMELIPTYWGSVNRWECDENDHLNVRFYSDKMNQSVQLAVSQMGIPAPDNLACIADQHMRFLAEARLAAPLRIDCGVVQQTEQRLELLSVMRHNVTDSVIASYLTTLTTLDLEVSLSKSPRVEVPEFAAPRGLDKRAAGYAKLPLAAAPSFGFRPISRGVIGPRECLTSGCLDPCHYVGRISDGMPNLWAMINGDDDAQAHESGEQGGAVLEYRLSVHQALRADQTFTVLSGIRAIGSKTQYMSHLMYDEQSGKCAASAEVLGIAMDLQSRKSAPISDERRAKMQAILLAPMSAA